MKTIMYKKMNRVPSQWTSCLLDQTATWSFSPYRYLKNRNKKIVFRYRRGRIEPLIFINLILINKNSQLMLVNQLPRQISYFREAKTKVLLIIQNIDSIVQLRKTSQLWHSKTLTDLRNNRYNIRAFLKVHWVSMRLI